MCMYRLAARHMPLPWAVFSGVLYLLNPWVYERFLSGQWLVLLGYTLFPLCVLLYTNALESLRPRDWLKWLLFFAVYPIASIHFAYMAAFFLLALTVTHFVLTPDLFKKISILKIAKWALASVVVLTLVNSFWLATFFQPHATFVAISQTDFVAYQTETDPTLGIWGNVLALYGFWNTDFALPKDTLPYWFTLSAVILALGAVGGYISLKKRELLGSTLVWTFLPLLFLAVGFASPWSRPVTLFLYHYLPGFKGLRETDKITGLLAFAYAFLAPFGARRVAQLLAEHTLLLPAAYTKKIVFAIFFAVPFLIVHSMFNGFAGQVLPADYPQSWYQANEMLQTNATHEKEKVLFLPWWGYLRFPFAHNVLVGNPASQFFDAHMVAGTRYENIHMPGGHDSELDTEIARALAGTESPDAFAAYLQTNHFTHVLLAKEQDTPLYAFLFHTQGLKKALDTGDLVLFSLK